MVIHAGGERPAAVRRQPRVRRSTIEEHLLDHRRDLRHRSREHREQRAAAIGPGVLAYVAAIFDSEDVLMKLRSVPAAVTHFETFPRERAGAACARGLLRQLRLAGTEEHLPARTRPAAAALPTPRLWLAEARHSRPPNDFLKAHHGNHR